MLFLSDWLYKNPVLVDFFRVYLSLFTENCSNSLTLNLYNDILLLSHYGNILKRGIFSPFCVTILYTLCNRYNNLAEIRISLHNRLKRIITYSVTTFARCIFCGWHLVKDVTFSLFRRVI